MSDFSEEETSPPQQIIDTLEDVEEYEGIRNRFNSSFYFSLSLNSAK